MTKSTYPTKYQLEHLKKRIDQEIDPLIDQARLSVKSIIADFTEGAELKLAKKIKTLAAGACERTLGCPGHSEEIHTFPGGAAQSQQLCNDGSHRRDARPAGTDRQIEGAPVREQGRRLPRDGRRENLRGLTRPRHPRLRRADAQAALRARRAGGAARRRARGPRRLRDLS